MSDHSYSLSISLISYTEFYLCFLSRGHKRSEWVSLTGDPIMTLVISSASTVSWIFNT